MAGVTPERLICPVNSEFFMPMFDDEGGAMRQNGHERLVKKRLLDLLATQLINGCDFNILVMDEANPALREVLLCDANASNDDIGAREQLTNVRAEIVRVTRAMRHFAGTLPAAVNGRPRAGTLRFTKVRRGVIMNRITMSERRAIITPIFHSLTINGGPCFDVMHMQRPRTGVMQYERALPPDRGDRGARRSGPRSRGRYRRLPAPRL